MPCSFANDTGMCYICNFQIIINNNPIVMKFKPTTLNLLGGVLLAMAVPFTAHAELLVEEYFDYNIGQLPGQGSWIRTAHDGTQKLNVVNSPLVYKGYNSNVRGKAAQITSSSFTGTLEGTDQDAVINFTDKDNTIKSGKVYASMLINVQEGANKDVYALCFAQSIRETGIIEGKSPTEFGKIYIKKGSDDSKYLIGVSRNAGKPETGAVTGDLPVGETALLVMAYEFVDGSNNDKVYVWVNPVCGATEPEATFTVSTGGNDVSQNLGLQGFELRQGTTASGNISARLCVDALRIGTDWADLFKDGGDNPETGAVISPSLTSVSFDTADGFLMQHLTSEKTIVVKAKDLTEDITVESSVEGLELSATTISKDEACSDAGAQLTLKFTATKADALPGSIVLKSAGAPDATVNLTATIVAVIDEARFSALNLTDNEDGKYYRYTGSMAKVSYVDEVNKDIYMQDMTGAIRISYVYSDITECPLKAGDKVKNIYLTRMDDVRGRAFIPLISSIGQVTSSGNEVTPAEVSFTEIKGDLDSYLYKLVTVKDVTITRNDGATWSTSGMEAADERGQGRVRAFANTDIIGTEVPAFAPAVTGISTSVGLPVVTVRSAADVQSAPAEMEISHELKIQASEYQKINVPVEYAVFTVKATALTAPVSIWIGGKGRDMFSVDKETIPAGSGIHQIKVIYNPTTTGTHEARINFETTPTDLNQGFSMSARAYDPQNPPVITVDDSDLKPFSAKVGETQKQTIKYTVKNLVNYGTMKVATANGFIISSASTPIYDGTYNLEISFTPQSEGTFTNTITFSADLAESVVVNLSGSTTGGQEPEQVQGDKLAFEGPARQSYSTDFTSACADNTPVKLDGWKNVAAQGTRAWWSSTRDNNQMVKVTAYDSKATETTPCQMLLLSPRLDFENAPQRLLCFNVMGLMMTDNMTDRLDVAYVDAKAAEADPENVVYNVIDGLNIPAIADENGNWARYVLDLDSWEMPEEFYIAFEFTSDRGKDNVATYFIDDFSWGRTDMPFIRSSHQLIETTAPAGQKFTSEEITATGFNLTEPIKLSLSGTHAKNFTLSTTELPAEGGKFTVDFLSEEQQEHVAIVSMQSGSDALSHVMFVINTDMAAIDGIAVEGAEWGDTVSVFDLSGRVLLTDAPVADALRLMKADRGTLYLVRTASGDTFKYIAK